jgi:hypothetical protein
MDNPSLESHDSLKKILQTFQAKRIAETYTDIEKNSQYSELYHFFLEYIYGPQDFGFRNESIKSLHHKMSKILKGEIIHAVGKVIELNDLSENLDDKMVFQMKNMGVNEELDMEKYKIIYRKCNNYDARVDQINLLLDSVKAIHHISQMRFIGFTLKAVNKAAHIAGFGKIMDFLVAGYEAFHQVKDIEDFANIILMHEMELNNNLFEVSH